MHALNLDWQIPHVMAILNVTPDSFSDGGKYFQHGQADLSSILQAVETMLVDGASIIDVGGESTRPGAEPVSIQQELDRVIPVIGAIKANFDVTISLDSSKVEVMREAAEVGVDLINDVCALTSPGSLDFCVEHGLPVVLMAGYEAIDPSLASSIVEQVFDYLHQRIAECLQAGLSENQIIIDPGFGFGKGLEGNIELMKHMPSFAEFNKPIAVGLSRKKMIPRLLQDSSAIALESGSVALAVLAYKQGAQIIRAHDVKSTKSALKIATEFLN